MNSKILFKTAAAVCAVLLLIWLASLAADEVLKSIE